MAHNAEEKRNAPRNVKLRSVMLRRVKLRSVKLHSVKLHSVNLRCVKLRSVKLRNGITTELYCSLSAITSHIITRHEMIQTWMQSKQEEKDRKKELNKQMHLT